MSNNKEAKEILKDIEQLCLNAIFEVHLCPVCNLSSQLGNTSKTFELAQKILIRLFNNEQE